MFFATAVTTETDAFAAASSLVEQVVTQMEDRPLHLALVFTSAYFTYDIRKIIEGMLIQLEPEVLLGCTAEGVIGRDQEIEGGAAITVVGAHLPGVSLTPFNLQSIDWPRTLLDSEEFRWVIDAPEDTKLFLVLGDPFSIPMDDVLQAFNASYPGIPVVGGMASGALRPHGNALILNDVVTDVGAVGVALSGALDVDIIVSQGCRPIWRPFVVKAAFKNTIFSLDDKPPLAWIQSLIPELSEDDRALLKNGLFIGRAVNPQQETLGQGDFLIRGVVGIDQQKGAITIGDYVQEGETIQFHVRDAYTAKEDLEMMLIPQTFRHPPEGALLFSCNGRGTRLYGHPNGDVSVIQKSLGGMPLAGCFCAGEIGPIGESNFLHGHTASLVIFRSLLVDEQP